MELIDSGRVRIDDRVRVLPSGIVSKVSRIVTFDADLREAVAGQSVTLCFSDAIDCSRGDVLTAADFPVEVTDQFEGTLVWMSEEAMLPGRPYLAKIGTSMVTATVTAQRYEINVNTLEHPAGRTLAIWLSIARCLSHPSPTTIASVA